MTTPALRAAVSRAYAVFANAPPPSGPLNVCTHCCMPEDLERQMRAWPLRRLTARHFYEYCTGAMGWLEQPVPEVRYLLPRWLELLAEGEQTHYAIELALDRVGRCPPGSFIESERQVLEDFMSAYFDQGLEDRGPCDHGDDPVSLVIMADVAGLPLAPLLQRWTLHPGPASTLRFVRCLYWDYLPERRVGSPFARDRQALQATFESWLTAAETKDAFLEKLVSPSFIAHVQRACGHSAVPVERMVDAVFDHLSS